MDLHKFARGLCRKNASLRSKSGAKIFCIPKNTGCLPQINLELMFCIFATFCQEQICANPLFRPVFTAEQPQGCLYSIVLLLSIGLCLVKHESNFKYDANPVNSDGSKDYGIYQINSNYWCDRGTTKYSQCWQINTYGCGYPCSGKS